MRPYLPVVLLLLLLASGARGAGGDPVEIRDVDVYDRQVGLAETARFTWTVWNSGPLNLTYRVETAVTGARDGWTLSLVNGTIPALGHLEAVSVVLTVVHRGVAGEGANLAVEFRVFLGAAPVQVTTRAAYVGVLVPATGEKLVLGLFESPLKRHGAPWSTEWGVFLLDVLAWVGISVLVYLVLDPFVKRVVKRTETKVDDIVLGIVKRPVFWIVLSFGAVNSLEAIDAHLDAMHPDLLTWVRRVYLFILTLSLFWIGYRIFKDLILHYGKVLAKKTASKVDDVLIPLVEKLGTVFIGLAFLGYVLGIFAIDLSLFVAGGVVVSMVLAFAAQDTLSNFFSGIFLLLDRPFEEGHTVVLDDGDWYEVRRIGLRTTRLFRFKDATMVSIPNNGLVNAKVANFSIDEPGRMMYKFGVAYGSDIAAVKGIIWDGIRRCPNVRKEPEPIVRFDSMDESQITFFVLVWIDERANRFAVTDFLNTEVYDALNRAGIEIPFPQRTVWVRREPEKAAPVAGKKKAGRPRAAAARTGASGAGSGDDQAGDGGGEGAV